MVLNISTLGGHMAAAATGIDLNRLPDAALAAALRRSILDNLVLCIRDQALEPAGYRNAMALFGTPLIRRQASQHPDIAEINIISSEDKDVLGDGKRLVNGAYWHTDDSFMTVPCSLTMLYGVEVPAVGGDTQFTNMYAAHDALSATMKERIASLRVLHKWDSSRKGTRVATLSGAMPEATHPLVRTHPEGGRKSLYLNPNRMEQVVDMDRANSDALLDQLVAHATQPQFQYRHKWRQGDIVIWDNRCTMHKANADYPDGARRFMHRIVIEGTIPV
jgi:taurine dioxygenase